MGLRSLLDRDDIPPDAKTVISEALAEHGMSAELIASIGQGILLVQGSDARVVYANARSERILGYDAGELIGRDARSMYAPSSEPPEDLARAIMGELDRTGEWRGEVRAVRKDGATIWCSASVSAFRDPTHGRLLVVMHADITDRKALEPSFAADRAYRKAIEAGLPSGITAVDSDGRLAYVNPAFCRMVGRGADEMLGQTAPFPYWPVEERDRAGAVLQAAVSGTAPPGGSDLVFQHKDGHRFDVHLVVTPLVVDGRRAGWVGSFLDITERKRVERALRESEQRLSEVLALSRDVVYRRDLLTDSYDYVSPAVAEVLGYTPDEAAETPIAVVLDLIHPDDRDAVVAAMDSGEARHTTEYRFLCKDGSYRWVEDLHTVTRDADGTAIYRTGTMRDVSERKHAELELARLREEDRGLGELLAKLHEVTVELSSAASVDELCRRAVELGKSKLGFSRLGIWLIAGSAGEIAGSYGVDERGSVRDERAVRLVLQPDWPCARLLKHEARILVEPDSDLYDDRRHPVGRGTRVIAAMWDGTNVVGGLCLDDLLSDGGWPAYRTELATLYAQALGHLYSRIGAHGRLQDSERRYRMLFEQSRDAIFTADVATGTIVDANAAAERLTGRSRGQIIGVHQTELHPAEGAARHRDLFKHHVTSGGSEPTEAEVLAADGTVVPVEITATVYETTPGVSVIQGHFRDMTERKRAEEQRRRLEGELQRAQHLESLRVLAGGVAHDFNNLLAGVLGNAELALEALPEGWPARSYIRKVELAATRGAELATQMLAYSGRSSLVVAPVDLSGLVRGALRLLESSLSKTAVIETELPGDLPPVKADAAQVRQAIVALATNASEALGDEAGLVTIRTGTVHADRAYLWDAYPVGYGLPEGRYVFVEVADTGCGMNAETKAKAFEPFFTTKFTGRGLGLAATLGIVRAHCGAIRLASEPEVGTTLTVLFPALEGVEAEEPPPASPPAGKTCGGRTILVADDEEMLRTLGATVLTKAGYEVVVAEDGHQAVAQFKAHADEIVAVLLDLTMPLKGGEQVFREIHPLRPNVPIILTSGYAEEDAVGQLAGLPIAGFIQKPYRPSELINKLHQVLEQSTSP